MNQQNRLGDVGMAIIEALKAHNVNKPCPKTRQYMIGLWTMAAARNRDNPVLHREMLKKAASLST